MFHCVRVHAADSGGEWLMIGQSVYALERISSFFFILRPYNQYSLVGRQ